MPNREGRALAIESPSGAPVAVGSAPPSVRRFELVALGAVAAASVVYFWVLWVLWGNTVDPLRSSYPGTIYDVQARAILSGHLSLPNGSIGTEAFVHDGHTYTYFGIFPSLLRIPILLVTHSLDGRLTSLSMGLAWLVTALFAVLLLWRVRVLVRGDAVLGWAEAASYGVLLASILVGSVLVFLASQPQVYSEDLAWSVALACGSLFALLGVVERPSWGRVSVAGVLVVLTNLTRSTTGYACILAAFVLSAWFALGRAGPERRSWALPTLLVGLLALAAGCAIDLAKFGLLFGFPASDQLLYREFGLGHINGGHYFAIRFLPSTLQAYVAPANMRVTPFFPFITLPASPIHPVAHTPLFQRLPTASVPASAPLLFGVGLWGVIAVFRPHRPAAIRALRILLIAAAVSGAVVMVFGWVAERFAADFMPLLVLASVAGMVDIWQRLDGRSLRARRPALVIIGLAALFGLVANVGFASAPSAGWTQAQLTNYVQAERIVGNLTGHALDGDVVRGDRFPSHASLDQLFVLGRCEAMYLSLREGPTNPAYPQLTWLLVEHSPHVPLCRSLAGQR